VEKAKRGQSGDIVPSGKDSEIKKRNEPAGKQHGGEKEGQRKTNATPRRKSRNDEGRVTARNKGNKKGTGTVRNYSTEPARLRIKTSWGKKVGRAREMKKRPFDARVDIHDRTMRGGLQYRETTP